MSEAAVVGKSYWEIVVHAFRKNPGARIALWISVAMLGMAIFAPAIANDRPYTFVGTLPEAYRKSHLAASGAAFHQVLAAPARLATEIRRFEDRSIPLNDYLRRINEDESAAQYEFITRLRKRAESRPDVRAAWISREVPVADVEAELKAEQSELPAQIAALKQELQGALGSEQAEKKKSLLADREKALASIPSELASLDAARRRIVRDLPAVHRVDLDKALKGFRLKMTEMGAQLDAPLRDKARDLADRLDRTVGADYLTTTEDRKPALAALRAEVREVLDPSKVVLRERRYWPVLDSLTFLDVFFISLSLLLGACFLPLHWLWLRRVHPIERRWMIGWGISAGLAALLSAGWLATHESKFETVSYKAGEASGAIKMSSALWPPLRYRYDEVPDPDSTSASNRPPHAPSAEHVFGTDFMGRDLLTRMIWGSRVSLSIGFVAEAIALVIGILVGALAGFYRGKLDMFLSRVIEIMICFPTLFLVLAVVAFLPPSVYYVMLVLGFFGWMGIARLQRGEFFRLINLDFVQAARALGASDARIMFRHLLPNAMAPVLVAASFGIAGAMLTESSLSFLGFGVTEPETSWGQILYTGRDFVQSDKWWTWLIPGAAIFVAVTCYNLVGDGIRDATDPRLKG